MRDLFQLLFGDHSGQLVVANLHNAQSDQVLHRDIIIRFASRFNIERIASSSKPARSIAEDIVFAKPHDFQLAGPEIRSPRKNLLNIRPLSEVHYMLTTRDSRPSDPQHMLQEVRAIIAARPDDIFGREKRLLWIAEQDEEIQEDLEWLLGREVDRSNDGAAKLERIMLYYGLPILSGTTYLLTEFSAKDWGSQPNDTTYRRPTAFDGVDGDYFKQRRLRPCAEQTEWNKTVDLGTALDAKSDLGDGAWEAVGMPLQMTRVKRTAIVLSSAEARPVDPKLYVDCMKRLYDLAGIDWARIPALMAAALEDGGTNDANK